MALRAVRLAHVALVESTSVAMETLETDNWKPITGYPTINEVVIHRPSKPSRRIATARTR